jgi:hypothetical protein
VFPLSNKERFGDLPGIDGKLEKQATGSMGRYCPIEPTTHAQIFDVMNVSDFYEDSLNGALAPHSAVT